MMREVVLGVFIGLLILVGGTTGVIFVLEGFTPIVERLLLACSILGIVGWVTATTME